MPQVTCSAPAPATTKQKPTTEESQRPEMAQLAGRDAVTARLRKRRAELLEEFDDVLDEIDEVLEENAEEFMSRWIQRGGE